MIALLCVTGHGADDGAAKVLDRYAEAIGGKAKLAQIKSSVIKGTFSLPGMGMYAPMETYSVPPGKFFSKVDLGDFGTAMNGVIGDVVWDINPMTGPRILTGGERIMRLRQAQVDQFANWSENFPKTELVGKERVDGAETSKVIMTPSEGEPLTGYFSEETGLLVKIESVLNGQTAATSVKNYKEVDGIKIAHLVEINTPQMSFSIEFESVEHNVDIPEERFSLPPQIQTLVDSK
jgi:hypothetical protein